MNARNIGVTVLVIVLLGVLFFFFVWSPLSDQQAALEEETTALEQQEQQLRNQLAQLEMIQDNELQIRADLNRLRSLIPPGDPAQPSFVRSAQLAADASGTNILSLTFGQPQPVEGAVANNEGLVLAQIGVNADVEGGYFQTVDLFRRFEIEVARAVQIDSLAVAEAEEGFPALTTSVTGRVFALLETAVIESVPDPNATPAEGETPEGEPTEGADAEAGAEGADGTTDGEEVQAQ